MGRTEPLHTKHAAHTKHVAHNAAPHAFTLHTDAPPLYTVVIIGAGPIGIEIAANLKKYRVHYLHIETGQIGHSITRWTPQTVFYSSPEWIALCGIPIQTDTQQQITGEQYLAYMRHVVETLELSINTFEKVTHIIPLAEKANLVGADSDTSPRFRIITKNNSGTHTYHTRNIVLAVGNMQIYNTLHFPNAANMTPHIAAAENTADITPQTTPVHIAAAANTADMTPNAAKNIAATTPTANTVDTPTHAASVPQTASAPAHTATAPEAPDAADTISTTPTNANAPHPRITYTLADPHHYFRKKLLIIGGKNSALEAALRCWRAGAHVTISYRKPHLTNKGVLDRIFLEIQLLIKNKQITLLAPTIPIACAPDTTTLMRTDTKEVFTVASDFVYIAIGYRPDYSLYEQAGVKLCGTEQYPAHNSDTMETNVPGIYVAGTAIAGHQTRYTVFITTCHSHAQRIVAAITARDDIHASVGNHRSRDYALSNYDLE